MTRMAQHINEMKRKHEHAVRIQEIQSCLYGWDANDLTTYGDLVLEVTKSLKIFVIGKTCFIVLSINFHLTLTVPVMTIDALRHFETG